MQEALSIAKKAEVCATTELHHLQQQMEQHHQQQQTKDVQAAAATTAVTTASDASANDHPVAPEQDDDQHKQQVTALQQELEIANQKHTTLSASWTAMEHDNKELIDKLARRAQQLETIHSQFAEQHETEVEHTMSIEKFQLENDQLKKDLQR